MDSLVTSLLVVAAFPFLYFLWKKIFHPFGSLSTGTNKKQAPRPAGKWPIIGHLPQLVASKELSFRFFANLADQHGPIFTLQLGVHQTLVISSWEFVKECLSENDRLWATRPPAAFGKHMAYNSGFSMAPYGPYWREIRKLATLELLSSRQVELLKGVRTTEVDLSIKDLYMQWVSNEKLPIMVDLKKWFGDLTFNITTMYLAGKRYFGANLIGDEKSAAKYREWVDRFFYLSGLFVVSDAIPWLEWLDLGGHIGAMKKVDEALDPLWSSWLEEHRQWRAAHPSHPNRDFVDIMLTNLEKPEIRKYDPDIVIKSTLLVRKSFCLLHFHLY